MIYSEKISLSAKGFCDVHDVTEKMREIIKKSNIQNGLASVFALGSTAGMTTIEYEPNLIKDLQEFFEKIIPHDEKYHHDETWGDNNGFSHLRASLLGPSLVVPVANGELTLGTWQQIVFINFDNRPRKREILVQVIGDDKKIFGK